MCRDVIQAKLRVLQPQIFSIWFAWLLADFISTVQMLNLSLCQRQHQVDQYVSSGCIFIGGLDRETGLWYWFCGRIIIFEPRPKILLCLHHKFYL